MKYSSEQLTEFTTTKSASILRIYSYINVQSSNYIQGPHPQMASDSLDHYTKWYKLKPFPNTIIDKEFPPISWRVSLE